MDWMENWIDLRKGALKLLELKNVSYEVLENGIHKTILDNISIKINDNQFIVMTGPNGSGKSTLAKIIMGIENPTYGKILLDNQDITKKSITERAKLGISFAFQQPVKFKGIQVIDLLKIASKKQISIKEACNYLSQVGLCAKEYINREMNSNLSGGELKRIEIAMLLARDSKIFIFDEPEAGIDLWGFQNLIDVFLKLKNKIKRSMLIISHQEKLLNIAQEIIVLQNGKIRLFGKKNEIMPMLLENEKVKKCTGNKSGGMYESNYK